MLHRIDDSTLPSPVSETYPRVLAEMVPKTQTGSWLKLDEYPERHGPNWNLVRKTEQHGFVYLSTLTTVQRKLVRSFLARNEKKFGEEVCWETGRPRKSQLFKDSFVEREARKAAERRDGGPSGPRAGRAGGPLTQETQGAPVRAKRQERANALALYPYLPSICMSKGEESALCAQRPNHERFHFYEMGPADLGIYQHFPWKYVLNVGGVVNSWRLLCGFSVVIRGSGTKETRGGQEDARGIIGIIQRKLWELQMSTSSHGGACCWGGRGTYVVKVLARSL